MPKMSEVLAGILAKRGFTAPTPEAKKRKLVYKTGFDLDVAYELVPRAAELGHKVYLEQCRVPFNRTVSISIYASEHEVFYLKAYCSSANQAEAAVEELTVLCSAAREDAHE